MTTLSPEERASVESEVEGILRGIYESIKRSDFGPWLRTLSQPAGQWLLNMDVVNIREGSENLLAEWGPDGENPHEHQEIDHLDIKVTVVNPSIAFALCTSPDRRWYFADGQVDRGASAETWVFTATEDGWKLHSGQTAVFPVEG